MMTISYFFGQKYYPIKYDVKTIGFYFVLALALFAIATFVKIDVLWLKLLFRTALLFIFIAILLKKDLPVSEIPFVSKFVKGKK